MNGPTNIRPWHWLTILSLDAPVVALVWQDFFARVFTVELRPAHRLLLGMSVWLGYMADRWLDGRKLTEKTAVTARHRFAQRFSKPIAVAWIFVFIGTFLLAIATLTKREFAVGIGLAATVIAYLAACHRQSLLKRFGWLKELAVSVLVSGGAAVFVFARSPTLTASHFITLFILIVLCLLNCAVVSVWEQGVDTRQAQQSLAIRFGLKIGRVFKSGVAFLAVMIGFAVFARSMPISRTALAAAITTVGALGLVQWGGAIDLETRHLLIDVTLLSPVLLIPFL
ncbi:hypothetical protein GC207_08840 [bacterium]|nr:hypothetical protein [bacterium]